MVPLEKNETKTQAIFPSCQFYLLPSESGLPPSSQPAWEVTAWMAEGPFLWLKQLQVLTLLKGRFIRFVGLSFGGWKSMVCVTSGIQELLFC